MAITKKQYPANLHSVFLPTHYTYQTDLVYDSNFRFKYELFDIDGSFFTGLTVPLEDNLSYNNPTEILKYKTEFNFQPDIDYISNVPNNCLVYRERVEEYVDSGASTAWYTKCALRYSDPLFNPYNNFVADDANSDFLVNMPTNHNIRVTDEFTFRTYNGYMNVASSSDGGFVYVYKMQLFDDGLNTGALQNVVVESMKNSYLGESPSAQYDVTKNGDNFIIDLPAGIENFKNTKFTLRNFTDSNGVYHDASQTLIYLYGDGSTNHLWFNYNSTWYNIWVDNYDYWAYRWPYGTSGQISKKHNFKVITNCRFDAVNVAWENTKGGVDYYLFTKANEKRIETKKDIYKQNLFTLNITQAEVEKNLYNKGTNVYRNNTDVIYELHTDWLNQDEINGMEDLFKSTEVYMNIDGNWNYVISLEKNAVIYNKKRKGLKKYKLNFALSENHGRY